MLSISSSSLIKLFDAVALTFCLFIQSAHKNDAARIEPSRYGKLPLQWAIRARAKWL
jgi:hypothetical protein